MTLDDELEAHVLEVWGLTLELHGRISLPTDDPWEDLKGLKPRLERLDLLDKVTVHLLPSEDRVGSHDILIVKKEEAAAEDLDASGCGKPSSEISATGLPSSRAVYLSDHNGKPRPGRR